MSHMSNKNVDELNAKRIAKVEGYVCDECHEPYWTGYNGRWCSRACFEAYNGEQTTKISEMTIEELINNPLDAIEPIVDREHEKVNNLRTGKTLPLR